jgi:PTH1 family peptidyl-tRNA hydrolase
LSSSIKLIAGLGNPGSQYENTRHNVGFWFIDTLARSKGVNLKLEKKFHGVVGKFNLGSEIWLLKPNTYMNRSGQSVSALAKYYKIAAEEILVVHDELDLLTGTIKIKQGGGHAGNNGIRDIIASLSNNGFLRLRIGIGQAEKKGGTDYVLGTPSKADKEQLNNVIDEIMAYLPEIINGGIDKAMNHLHSLKP